jgi:hypothetical protein
MQLQRRASPALTAIDAEATARTRARYDRLAPIYDHMERGIERRCAPLRAILWKAVMGPRMDLANPLVVRLMGSNINRETVTSIQLAGFVDVQAEDRVLDVLKLSRQGLPVHCGSTTWISEAAHRR